MDPSRSVTITSTLRFDSRTCDTFEKMQDHELIRVIDQWARATLRDPHSGAPLDAKLDVRPARYDITLGSLRPGESRPREGIRTRTFEVLVSLGLFEDDRTARAIGPMLRDAAREDPTLGQFGKFHAEVSGRGQARGGRRHVR